MIRTILAGVCFALGVFVFFSEVFGLFRLKYVLNRMHATALGDTFGIFMTVLGCVILKGFCMASVKLLLVVLFLFFTGPVATHLISQAQVRDDPGTKADYQKEDRT